MPSEQISTLLHLAEKEPESRAMPEEQRQGEAQVEQPVIAEVPVDPYFCDIEEAIDECERRIKAEESRYAKLVANREVYEHWMDPFDFKVLMRQSATRLVNFDPCFDLPAEEYPLPRPWDHHLYY